MSSLARASVGAPRNGPPCACTNRLPLQRAGTTIRYGAPAESLPRRQRAPGGGPSGQVTAAGAASAGQAAAAFSAAVSGACAAGAADCGPGPAQPAASARVNAADSNRSRGVPAGRRGQQGHVKTPADDKSACMIAAIAPTPQRKNPRRRRCMGHPTGRRDPARTRQPPGFAVFDPFQAHTQRKKVFYRYENRSNQADSAPARSPAISRNCSSAASRSSTISCAMTSGGGRLSLSARASSLSQKMSRLALSRAISSA
jgi:hypothetical protein